MFQKMNGKAPPITKKKKKKSTLTIVATGRSSLTPSQKQCDQLHAGASCVSSPPRPGAPTPLAPI